MIFDQDKLEATNWFNTAHTLAKKAARTLSNAVIPPVCLSCHAPLASRNTLCASCWNGISFIQPPLCDRLGIPLPFDTGGVMISAAAEAHNPVYRKARAVAHYDGIMRALVHDFKFRDRHDKRQLFSSWLQQAGRDLINDCDVIIPVPLSRIRLLTRRFNQAAIIAHDIATKNHLTYHPLILFRTKLTKSQVGLTRDQRHRNVQGAFSVSKRQTASIKNQRVLLIDDVITTGATANACARTLLRAGAAHVDVLALALVADAHSMTT